MKKNHSLPGGIVTLFVISVILIQPVRAQDINMPELDGFRIEQNYPVYTPDDLWDYINGAADSYNALGFVDLTIAEYVRGRKNNIKLEIYRHTNNNMAFGIYSMERSPTYKFNELGAQGYSDNDHVHFFKGNYYIKISTHSSSKKAIQGMNDLAVLVDQNLEGEDKFPEILSLFPDDGKKVSEEIYIADNVLGHEFLRKAFRVSYEVQGNSFSVYLFNEGGAEIISEMADSYLARLDLDSGPRSEGKVFFTDGYNGPVFLAWRGGTMVLINGLEEEQTALADRYITNFIK